VNVRLLQLADSALPIGGYTHSWGLETAIANQRVHDPASLESWTRRWLNASLAPLEGVLVACSSRAAADADMTMISELAELANASIIPPSVRQASYEMGEQLIALGRTWQWSADRLARFVDAARLPSRGWHHAIAFGVLGAVAGGTAVEVLTAYLHQATLGMIGAGVRAIPLGHTHGQQVLAYLQDDICRLASELSDAPANRAGAGCPFYEVLCHEQTQLYARMFRS
jgi:urease accessory protein